MAELTFREAIREAMSEAMEQDPRVFLMGEDVGRYGGCYAVSKGMLERFGPERVIDTPLSESGFVGAGIGAAMGGMRPIVEVMTVNFSLLALDQIVNNAATLLHMSGGQLNVPVVIRMACGAGKQLAAQHSHSFEGWYAHVPGLKVLYPGTVQDARYMLQQALDDPDPVVIFEHVMLYNQAQSLEAVSPPADMHQAQIRRPGTDVTLFAWGACLGKALDAAELLSQQGISARVLDLRCLRPLDNQAIVACVSETHRVVIVDESWKTGGMSAEISALICEQAFEHLHGPVVRVCSQEVPIPYPAHLEQAALPQVEQIVSAARQLVNAADAGQSAVSMPQPGLQDRSPDQPDGLIELKMPSFGSDMASGELSEWLVAAGDSFRRGDVLAVIETQKGAIELDAHADAKIAELLVPAGQQVAVGAPIALLTMPTQPKPTQFKSTPSKPQSEPVPVSRESKPEVAARPFEQDAMRQAISATVSRSKQTIPHYYLQQTLDLTALKSQLAALNQDRVPEQRIMLQAPLLCAIARALVAFPQLNGWYQEGVFQASPSVDLATAVNLRGGGLVMPVLHQAETLEVETLASQLNELLLRAKSGTLRQSDLQGASCSVSSLGERGAEVVFGVIFPPQVALIGLGKPVSHGSTLSLAATLSADHRCSDGHLGSNFLNRLSQMVQQPEELWSNMKSSK